MTRKPNPPVRAVAIHPDDEETTALECRAYAAYLRDHAERMVDRRNLADVYAIAAALVLTFTVTDGLVLTPETDVHAFETARTALALAFEVQATGEWESDEDNVHDYGGFGTDEARVSFDGGDTFPTEEELSEALAEIGESIRREAMERPKAFGAWQTEERARVVSERAKRRGKR